MAGAWFVGVARWRRHWRRLVFLGVVAGVIGGAVLGALAGARRTSSAYDRLFASAGSPNEALFLFGNNVPQMKTFLEHEPTVERFLPAAGLIGRRSETKDWYSLYAPADRSVFPDRKMERGRMPRNDRPDEVFITLRTARNTGLDVGDEIVFDAYAHSQLPDVQSNPWAEPKGQAVKVKIVGIARDPSDAQLSQSIKLVFGTPAVANRFATTATFTPMLVWLKGGRATEPAFEARLNEYARTKLGSEGGYDITPSRNDKEAADNSSNAVVVGLLIFAIVAGIAGLVLIVQTVRRSLSPSENEGEVLRALGASHTDRAVGLFIAGLPYVVAGTIVAVAISVAVSPIFPIGATRALEPAPGLRADPLVILAGGAAWFALLAAVAITVSWVEAERRARRPSPARARGGELGSAANGRPSTVGVRFALQPGVRRSALHRSALVGVVIAVIGVISCVVFTSSLRNFVDTPPRYGIDFDLSIEVPTQQASARLAELATRTDLEAVAGIHVGNVDIEGRRVAASAMDVRKGTMQPTMRDGALPTHDDEIAIGPKLLTSLHKKIGDTVRVNYANDHRTMKIVGTALSPGSESSAFNEEAVMTLHDLNNWTDWKTSPEVQMFVRATPGTDVKQLMKQLDEKYPYGVSDESPARAPGPVRNLEQIRRLPLVLALFFGFLGLVALAQSIFMTGNERRRDLSVLRVIGYTRRQVGAVLRGAGTSVALVALIIGVPAGILAGRFGWRVVTNGLHVTTVSAVPLVWLTLIAVGLIVFAVLVAMIPAYLALRRTPGSALRSE
jgi:ABC-type lipoprotein release transport system permease subunit